MKRITFKNGHQIKVTNEVANLLRDRILSGEANDFQCYTDPKNDCTLIIKLSEIQSLESSENSVVRMF